MTTFVYSLSSRFREESRPTPEQLLLTLSDSLLATGDMKKSLQDLLIGGMNHRLPGLSHMLTQVKQIKASLLREYDVRHALASFQEKLRQRDDLQEAAGLSDRRGTARDTEKTGGRSILDLAEQRHKAHQSKQHPLASTVALLEELTRQMHVTGTKPLAPEHMFEFIDRITLVLQVERDLQRAVWGFDLEAIDAAGITALLGPEGRAIWENLKQIKSELERAGLLEAWKDTHRLTRKAFRIISSKLLKDILDLLQRDLAGSHTNRFAAGGGIDNMSTRPYEFGLPLHLHLSKTGMNAVMRHGKGLPLSFKPEDFEVYDPEPATRCATVLMLDMSKSMKDRNNFLMAKKVILALHDLMSRKFPRDLLEIVGFSTIARIISPEQLPYLLWDAEQPYTNIQDGLRLSLAILRRSGYHNQQIILITDGEPTAHAERGNLYFQFPPHPRTLVQTLEEVKRCTRQGVVITTFMLVKSNPLTNFVEEVAKINQGRAYYADADHLGESVIVNYLTGRQRKRR